MEFRLAPPAEAQGFALRAFDTVGSTSAEALTFAREGEPGPLWVVSPQQTAGRGRRGRSWETPHGNLAASLMVRTEVSPVLAATLGFVAGVALSRALRACCGERPVTFALKWPNDVLANGAKIAGILLEAEATAARSRPVVIGIGVNVVAAPRNVPYPVTSLRDLGFAVSAPALFEALSKTWAEAFELWDEGRGLAQIRTAWLACAAGLGSPVAIRHGQEVVSGVFETIDPDGQLVLRADDGARRLIAAGDVHFGLAATARA
jgi:BirA family biotin operon repressor/biotin-[acetyl-CoA-carboxylase] ligase